MADRNSAALAISTGALVVGVWSASLPTLAEARAQADDRGHLAAAEKYAAIVSIAVVLGVAGVTGSPEAAAVGLLSVLAMAAAYHNAVNSTP